MFVVDLTDLIRVLRKGSSYIDSNRPLETMMIICRHNIRTRSQAQVSYTGDRFAPLKPKYRIKKLKMGGKGVRDLTLSGKLLTRLGKNTDRSQIGQVVLSPHSSDRKKAEGNQMRSPFMGVTSQDVAQGAVAIAIELEREMQ